MTVPSFVGSAQVTSASAGWQGASPLSVAIPSGQATDDIVLIGIIGSRQGDVPNFTTPTGFTQLLDVNANPRLKVYWQRRAGSNIGTASIPYTDGFAFCAAFSCLIRGAVNTGSPFESVQTGNGLADSPNVVTTGVDRLVLDLHAGGTFAPPGTGASDTPSASWTKLCEAWVNDGDGNAGSDFDCSLLVQYLTQATAGTVTTPSKLITNATMHNVASFAVIPQVTAVPNLLASTGATAVAFAATGIAAQPLTYSGAATAAFASAKILNATVSSTGATTVSLVGTGFNPAQLVESGGTAPAFVATIVIGSPIASAPQGSAVFFNSASIAIVQGALASTGATAAAFASAKVLGTAVSSIGASAVAFTGRSIAGAQLAYTGASSPAFAATAIKATQLTVTLATTVDLKFAATSPAQFASAGVNATVFTGLALSPGLATLISVGTSSVAFAGRATAAAQLSYGGATTAAFAGAATAATHFTIGGSTTFSVSAILLTGSILSIAGVTSTNLLSKPSGAGLITSAAGSSLAFAGSRVTNAFWQVAGQNGALFFTAKLIASPLAVPMATTLNLRGTARRDGALVIANASTPAFAATTIKSSSITIMAGNTNLLAKGTATSKAALASAAGSSLAFRGAATVSAVFNCINGSQIVWAAQLQRHPTVPRSRAPQSTPTRAPVTTPSRPPFYG